MGNIEIEAYRHNLRQLAEWGDEYAGIPMPVFHEKLVVHPSYRFAEVFKDTGDPEPDTANHFKIRNIYRSRTKPYAEFIIAQLADGRITGGFHPIRNALSAQFSTVGASAAWDIAAELKAQVRLAQLLKPHSFQQYILTGAFLETSKRSKVTYMFRRLRPTLAVSTQGGNVRCLAALCLHPIGYYEGTWAGAMCPTDEIIAHLLLMRGDEHDYWKQANQHHPVDPRAGL